MRPIIIGIAEGTSSGKSTFCELLSNALDCYRIGIIIDNSIIEEHKS